MTFSNPYKGKDLKSELLIYFINERPEFITEERIATMGRLSELQLVNWEIDSQGKSKYSLNQEKYQILN